MKLNNLLYLGLGAAMLALSSCSDFLDQNPKVTVAKQTYYSNDKEANTAIVGLYSFLQLERTEVGPIMVVGDDCSDDCTIGNSKSEAYSWFGGVAEQMISFETQPNNWLSNQSWQSIWFGISNCVQALDRLEANKEAIGNKYNQYVGEARFLRAAYYFLLTRMYGRQPLMEHTFNYEEFFTPRATIEQTWQFIEDDLKAAAELLPEKSQYEQSDLGRATKGAALTLLGKCYLYQSKWQDTYDTLLKVIQSGEYDLEPNYADVFDLDHENGIESIFEIQHSISGTGWSDANEGNILSFYEHDATDDGVKWHSGWSMHCPTQDLVDEYEAGDPRLKATILFPDEYFDGRVNKNIASPTGYHSKKWYVPYAQRSQKDQSDNPKNVILMRYADVLLQMAEACNELDLPDKALVYLKKVRDRARNSAQESTTNLLPAVTTTDKEALRNAIYHERRVELACEGERFYDLVRQGRAGKVMKAYQAKYGGLKGKAWKDGKSELQPLPEAQVTLSNGNLEQNPHY